MGPAGGVDVDAISTAVADSAPFNIFNPADHALAGNAQAAYATRLAPTAEHVRALPTAAALLRLAPALLAAGQDVDASGAMPLYLRDKVAQTTAEREALRMGKPA